MTISADDINILKKLRADFETQMEAEKHATLQNDLYTLEQILLRRSAEEVKVMVDEIVDAIFDEPTKRTKKAE